MKNIIKNSLILTVLLCLISCTGYNFSVKSISYQKVRKIKKIKLMPVKTSVNLFDDSVSKDFLNFLSFSLEKKGFVIVNNNSDKADLILTSGLRINRSAVGIEERHSIVFDIFLKKENKSVVHLFSVYEGAKPLIPGPLLTKITDKIASEFSSRIGKE